MIFIGAIGMRLNVKTVGRNLLAEKAAVCTLGNIKKDTVLGDAGKNITVEKIILFGWEDLKIDILGRNGRKTGNWP